MDAQIDEKKAGGRPSHGLRLKAIFFLSESLMNRINEWRNGQEVVPSFSAAVRVLISRALEQEAGK
jgi:hypothetical protein